VADVAGVAAVQVSDPIGVFVLVEADNGSFHSNSSLIRTGFLNPSQKISYLLLTFSGCGANSIEQLIE
jgi:hypothetical protein